MENIHALILKEIDNKNAGRYRNENVLISGAKHIPPKHFELMRCGYTPIIMKKKQRTTYYDVLDLARTTLDYGTFVQLVAELVVESEQLWLSVLE